MGGFWQDRDRHAASRFHDLVLRLFVAPPALRVPLSWWSWHHCASCVVIGAPAPASRRTRAAQPYAPPAARPPAAHAEPHSRRRAAEPADTTNPSYYPLRLRWDRRPVSGGLDPTRCGAPMDDKAN